MLEVEDIDGEQSQKVVDFPDIDHTYSTKHIAPTAKSAGYIQYNCSCGGTCEAENTEEYKPFSDVKKGAYYYDPVIWASENNITQGTGNGTFQPDMDCSRAQVVTFLWRAAGEPTTDSDNPFSDIEKGYYYDAVLWAVENGITNGTGDTTFSPLKTCSRGETVTFLYRCKCLNFYAG